MVVVGGGTWIRRRKSEIRLPDKDTTVDVTAEKVLVTEGGDSVCEFWARDN